MCVAVRAHVVQWASHAVSHLPLRYDAQGLGQGALRQRWEKSAPYDHTYGPMRATNSPLAGGGRWPPAHCPPPVSALRCAAQTYCSGLIAVDVRNPYQLISHTHTPLCHALVVGRCILPPEQQTVPAAQGSSHGQRSPLVARLQQVAVRARDGKAYVPAQPALAHAVRTGGDARPSAVRRRRVLPPVHGRAVSAASWGARPSSMPADGRAGSAGMSPPMEKLSGASGLNRQWVCACRREPATAPTRRTRSICALRRTRVRMPGRWYDSSATPICEGTYLRLPSGRLDPP